MIRFELQLSLTQKKKICVFFPPQAYLWKDGLRGKSQSEVTWVLAVSSLPGLAGGGGWGVGC